MKLTSLPALLFTLAIVALLTPGCDDASSSATASNAQADKPQVMTITGGKPKTEPLTATADTRLIVVDVEGMTCQGCAWTIAEAAKKIPGAVDASASFEQNKAWLLVGHDSDTNAQQLAETINALADGQMFTATVTK